MNFEIYLKDMEVRRKREKEQAINAELKRARTRFTHDEAVERMFFLLGKAGEVQDLPNVATQSVAIPV